MKNELERCAVAGRDSCNPGFIRSVAGHVTALWTRFAELAGDRTASKGFPSRTRGSQHIGIIR